MKRLTPDEIRARRDAIESTMIGTRWYSPAMLAARWSVSPHTVRNLPDDQLRYKDFGRGARKRRRYKEEWVVAFENAHGAPPQTAHQSAA